MPSDILSNSSIQQMPLSLRTRAPLQPIQLSSHKDGTPPPPVTDSRLQDVLPGLGVLGDVGCQAHSGGALAGCVLATRHQAVHVLVGGRREVEP